MSHNIPEYDLVCDSDILAPEPVQYKKLPYIPFRCKTFTSKSGYLWFQVLKLCLGAVFLLPIRILLAVVLLPLCNVVAYAHHRKLPASTGPNPDMKEASYLVVILNRLIRLFLFCFGLTSIEFKGKVPVDYDNSQPWIKHPVVVGPHSCGTFDWALVVAKATRCFSPIMKIEIGKSPLVSNILRTIMPIWVDRSSGSSRKKSIQETIHRVNEGTEKGWFPILCFPEGTNANRKQILKFKPGIFIPGKPVQPILIKYSIDDNEYENDLVTWAHFGRSVVTTLLLCMCRLQTTIVYHFMDPYFPTVEEQRNPALYAENVRQLMSKELKRQATDWTFEDAKLMIRAKAARFQPEIGAIRLHKIYPGIRDKEKHAMDLLNKFLKVLAKYSPGSEDGRITGMLPILEREILLIELVAREDLDFYRERLPAYVSFEQFCLVNSKLITAKLD